MDKSSFIRLRVLHGKIYEKNREIKRKLLLWNSRRIISQLKDSHKGERCFIIGNGPSLNTNDIDWLKSEITFATNRIYHIFNQTDWRPTYYCVQDFKLIKESFKDINAIKAARRFVGFCDNLEFQLLSNFVFIRLFLEPFYPELPRFSDNLISGIFEGCTVTYMCLQIAIYMGFSEIVLLGIDHSYSVELLPDGSLKTNDVMDHFDSNDKTDNLPQPAKTTLAYQAAKVYCDNHNVKVFNATRGGKLEVFERKDLESFF